MDSTLPLHYTRHPVQEEASHAIRLLALKELGRRDAWLSYGQEFSNLNGTFTLTFLSLSLSLSLFLSQSLEFILFYIYSQIIIYLSEFSFLLLSFYFILLFLDNTFRFISFFNFFFTTDSLNSNISLVNFSFPFNVSFFQQTFPPLHQTAPKCRHI
ncbi:unnamed protein product [Acanthosepion pharaonis]|uniref:Uncharacterized protein n=1 Tax=Acanthosepion pharaonis TaxID=158019 RepID=A0A812AT65_ACAPH|nr:unnamed protein product [Sepia pharaonis]